MNFSKNLLFTFLLTALTASVHGQSPASVASNTWGLGAPMPTARMGSFTGAINNKIYVVGGENISTIFAVNEVYDPASNTWTTASPMPTPRALGASAVVNGILYIMGGQTPSSPRDTAVQSYNPLTDTWNTG